MGYDNFSRTGSTLPPLLAATALAGAFLACGGGDAAGRAGGEPRAPAVEALPARTGSLPIEERLGGVVRARDQVEIRPQIESTVTEVLVRNGDAVERGDVLVRLRAEALFEQQRQAEAGLRVAEASSVEARARAAETESRVRRMRALAEQELTSEMELEALEAQLEVARAQAAAAAARVEQQRAAVQERRADVEEAVVRAPVAGRIGRRAVEVGQLVDTGDVLFVLGGLERMVVEVPLTDTVVERVEVGTPVRLESRHLATPIDAAISRISPFLETASFSTTAEIDVANADGSLRPGMFVNATVLLGRSEQATLVPTAAVWEDPRTGRSGVFVVLDAADLAEVDEPVRDVGDRLRRTAFRPVEVLARGAGTAGVRGVEAQEWVVTVGHHLLREQANDQRAGEDGSEPSTVEARVRPVPWERVLGLQGLQREDLLAGFLDKQQRIARAIGPDIPESESVVDEILAAPVTTEAGAGGAS